MKTPLNKEKLKLIALEIFKQDEFEFDEIVDIGGIKPASVRNAIRRSGAQDVDMEASYINVKYTCANTVKEENEKIEKWNKQWDVRFFKNQEKALEPGHVFSVKIYDNRLLRYLLEKI